MMNIYEKPLAIKVFFRPRFDSYLWQRLRNRVANLSKVGNPCTDGIKINEDFFMF